MTTVAVLEEKESMQRCCIDVYACTCVFIMSLLSSTNGCYVKIDNVIRPFNFKSHLNIFV